MKFFTYGVFEFTYVMDQLRSLYLFRYTEKENQIVIDLLSNFKI